MKQTTKGDKTAAEATRKPGREHAAPQSANPTLRTGTRAYTRSVSVAEFTPKVRLAPIACIVGHVALTVCH